MKHQNDLLPLKPVLPGQADAVKAATLTAYERANLMLQAFKTVDGWGEENDKGKWEKFDIEGHKKFAAEMVAWALGEDDG